VTLATGLAVATPAQAETASDRDLVARVLEGREESAFRLLYSRHTPSLYAIAMRLTGESADAEDAVHDVWVRALDALGRFEWRSSLRTWLTSILLNRIRELDRDERLVAIVDEESIAAPERLELPRNVEPMDLEAAIRSLPPGYRRVLVLHDIEGFTHDDIASLLDVSPGTSKSQLAHARQRLRRLLSSDEKEIR
jgi:RNA polymerase sigma-70 factor (ECF subfamily)